MTSHKGYQQASDLKDKLAEKLIGTPGITSLGVSIRDHDYCIIIYIDPTIDTTTEAELALVQTGDIKVFLRKVLPATPYGEV